MHKLKPLSETPPKHNLQPSSAVHSLVKNGFSDPTKEQEGQDGPRKDVMSRRQVKALREGCHEEKRLRWVSPQERR